MGRLRAEGAFVDEVTEQPEQEDCDGEGVAAIETVASCEGGERLVVVFAAGGEVPEGGVEDDAGGGDCGWIMGVSCVWVLVGWAWAVAYARGSAG